jgi:hypothetical protein
MPAQPESTAAVNTSVNTVAVTLVVPAQAGTQPVRLTLASEYVRFVFRQTNNCTAVHFFPLGPRLRGDDRLFFI